MAPIGSYVRVLGLQLVELLGRIRRCGLIEGGVSLGAGFEVSKEWCHFPGHSPFLASFCNHGL
ncbi:hypothetical protein I79_003453 [Cricetulus griseus]|uniref:Uncharacterized protein n=1 Tax=Cricetulus griseus TaxID=10029 RepID=G3H005_CRIGR|nr:hypothetical protein I79_003453 [Cricetulus griseus]